MAIYAYKLLDRKSRWIRTEVCVTNACDMDEAAEAIARLTPEATMKVHHEDAQNLWDTANVMVAPRWKYLRAWVDANRHWMSVNTGTHATEIIRLA